MNKILEIIGHSTPSNNIIHEDVPFIMDLYIRAVQISSLKITFFIEGSNLLFQNDTNRIVYSFNAVPKSDNIFIFNDAKIQKQDILVFEIGLKIKSLNNKDEDGSIVIEVSNSVPPPPRISFGFKFISDQNHGRNTYTS